MTSDRFGLPYPVVVDDGLIDRVGELAARLVPAYSYALVTDRNVGGIYGARVLASFNGMRASLFEIEAGESNKNVRTWSSLSEEVLAARFGRDSAIVAIGGGIVGDVAGFAAATFMRGVPYIQVPTTVVAMVDSSIGGKTGVNAAAGKNLLGAFHQPSAVLTDPAVLSTLSAREFRAGMAEVIKHGVIADGSYLDSVNAGLPEMLASRGAAPMMREVIARSIEIKAEVVKQDERESGMRKILNFGHTIGHAIEALSEYTMLHGEAISIGMCIESEIAERVGVASAGTAAAVRGALAAAALPTRIPAEYSGERVILAAQTDKKAREGEIEFALPAAVGQMAGRETGWSVRVPREALLAALG